MSPVIMAAHLSILLLVAGAVTGEPLSAGPAAADLSRRTYEVVASGHHAFAATTAGLTVYDVGDPAAPKIVATLLFPGSANGVTLSGTWIYLSLGPEGLRAIDVTQPASPRLAGMLDTDGSANASAPAAAGRLVIADGVMGLKVVDVSRPASMTIVGELDTGAYAKHLAVSGDLIAVAEDDAGVRFVRLAGDGTLAQLSAIGIAGSARGVAIEGNRCYVASGPAGLTILDISNPRSPRIAATFPSADFARGLAVLKGRILLADGNAGLRIIEAPQEAAGRIEPKLIGAFRTVRTADRVSIGATAAGRPIAFIAEDAGGIRLVDISAPGSPRDFGP